jgi:hypothetical protein
MRLESTGLDGIRRLYRFSPACSALYAVSSVCSSDLNNAAFTRADAVNYTIMILPFGAKELKKELATTDRLPTRSASSDGSANDDSLLMNAIA